MTAVERSVVCALPLTGQTAPIAGFPLPPRPRLGPFPSLRLGTLGWVPFFFGKLWVCSSCAASVAPPRLERPEFSSLFSDVAAFDIPRRLHSMWPEKQCKTNYD